MQTEITATDIAKTLCVVAMGDHLHPQIYNRVKYIAKRGLLENGREVDKRGTLAFPPVELFRAALLLELMGLAIDVRALRAVMQAASAKLPMTAENMHKTDGAYISHGALSDAIRGVAKNEPWRLEMWRLPPAEGKDETICAEFIGPVEPVANAHPDIPASVAAEFGLDLRKPTPARVTVDLAALFQPILALVRVPK